MASTSAVQRVENGCAFLDEHVPGWRSRVDLQSLDASDCWSCVLGQIFGDFDDAVRLFALSDQQQYRLGFISGLKEVSATATEKRYQPLIAAWKDALG